MMFKVLDSEIDNNRYGVGYTSKTTTCKEKRRAVCQLVERRELDGIVRQNS